MKILNKLVNLLIVTYASFSFAGPYPIVTSMQTTITGPSTAEYNVTWGLIDIPAADAPAPVGWILSSAHRHDAHGENEVRVHDREGCDISYCATRIKDTDTFSSAGIRVFNQLPSQQIIYHGGGGNGGECVGVVAAKGQGVPWYSVKMPGNICVYAPPGNDWCKITTPSLTLDHGQISLKDANEKPVSDWVNIKCTTATKVKLRLVSGVDYIPLQGNAKAVISVNDRLVGGVYDLQPDDNAVKISSQLQDVNDVGDYSGMSVLIIEPA